MPAKGNPLGIYLPSTTGLSQELGALAYREFLAAKRAAEFAKKLRYMSMPRVNSKPKRYWT